MQGRWFAVAGFGMWLVALAWLQPPLEVALLLLGPLVAAPLVLGLAHPGGPKVPLRGRWRLALLFQLPAAVAAVISFSRPLGLEAALWTLPWLGFAALLVLLALLRFLEHGLRPMAEVAVDAGLAFLFVGAFWLTISRWDIEFMGYHGPIVFYTAAHFHFAGLVLPPLGGLAARALPGKLGTATCFGLVSGMPFVAAGIVLEQQHGIHLVNVVAVSWLYAATLGVIVMEARLALRPGPILPRLLLGLSAAALPVGMTLAALFVYGNAFAGLPTLTYEQMVHTHAVVNVFGFALAGLLAWTVAGFPARTDLHLIVPALGDRLEHVDWAARPSHPDSGAHQSGENRDRYQADLGSEPPGEPEPGGPFRQASARLLAFEVYPRRIFRTGLQRKPVQSGDVLPAAFRLVPGLWVGLGVRVLETFDGPTRDGGWRTGFRDAALAGHPECGEATFAVEKDAAGHVLLVFESRSRPGHPLTRMVAKWTRKRQVQVSKDALEAFRDAGAAGTAR